LSEINICLRRRREFSWTLDCVVVQQLLTVQRAMLPLSSGSSSSRRLFDPGDEDRVILTVTTSRLDLWHTGPSVSGYCRLFHGTLILLSVDTVGCSMAHTSFCQWIL
jgi:hypothetical protein